MKIRKNYSRRNKSPLTPELLFCFSYPYVRTHTNMLLNALEQVENVSFSSLHYSNTSKNFSILMDEQTEARGDGVEVCVYLGGKMLPSGAQHEKHKGLSWPVHQ